MSIYMTPTKEWMDGETINIEYKVSGDLKEDILRRSLEPENDLTSVWVVKSARTDGHIIEVFIHPFGAPNRSVFCQDLPFEDPKDAQQNFIEWLFEDIVREENSD